MQGGRRRPPKHVLRAADVPNQPKNLTVSRSSRPRVFADWYVPADDIQRYIGEFRDGSAAAAGNVDDGQQPAFVTTGLDNCACEISDVAVIANRAKVVDDDRIGRLREAQHGAHQRL